MPNWPGTIMAHPLRGRGYEQDTPLLVGDFVTTEAGTGFVHIAPGHGEDDFDLGRANGLDVPETVGDDGTFNAWVPLFAGAPRLQGGRSDLRGADRGGHAAGAWQDHALLSAFLAVQGAADLSRDAAMVRPDGWAGADPEKRARGDRGDAFRAGSGPQPDRLDGGEPSGLVHQPPARLGRADHRVRREADRRAVARSGRGGAYHRRLSPPRGRMRGMHHRRRAFSAPDRNPDDYEQVMDIVDVWFEVRLDPCLRAGGAGIAVAGRPVSRRVGSASRLVPVVAAGSGRDARAGAVQGGSDATAS